METNICDINHLDGDVLLPPRKRLLAGFKKQSSYSNGNDKENGIVHPPAVASSSSPYSPSSEYSSEFNARLNNLLKSTTSNSNLSHEEIAELAESAAIAAVKAARDCRAAAEEKAAIATRAITAAKSALDLVASFNDSKERHLKKNKLKKHVPVQLLYKKNQSMGDSKTDEEAARRLHRVMNSSPRISKNLTSSDLKGHKHKKLKISPTSERTRVSNGGIVLGGNSGHAAGGEVDFENEGTFSGVYTVNADEKACRYGKTVQLRMGNGEAVASHSSKEETSAPARKRGRLKLKKLPLSYCSSRDRGNTKEGVIPLTDKNMGSPHMPLFSLEDGVMPMEATPWKCQNFKAPQCVKQNKVV